MGLLFIGVVAGILIGFGLVPSKASLQYCAPQGCLERAADSQPLAQKSMAVGPYPASAVAKSATAAMPVGGVSRMEAGTPIANRLID